VDTKGVMMCRVATAAGHNFQPPPPPATQPINNYPPANTVSNNSQPQQTQQQSNNAEVPVRIGNSQFNKNLFSYKSPLGIVP